MTPRAKRFLASYRRQMPTTGAVFSMPGLPDVSARARIVDFDEGEIASGILEGRRKMIVLAESFTWSGGLREGATVRFDGQDLYVNTVDDQRRRVDGTLIAYEIEASGL